MATKKITTKELKNLIKKELMSEGFRIPGREDTDVVYRDQGIIRDCFRKIVYKDGEKDGSPMPKDIFLDVCSEIYDQIV